MITTTPADSLNEPVAVAAAPCESGLAKRATLFRAADLLVELFVRNGIDVVFGIPGGAIGALLDALVDRPEIRVVTSRHESGAVFAAAAYARATGRTGAVMVTSGPGVLNTFTGMASAKCDSLPVLVITGEVARSHFGRGALQEGTRHHLNIVGMARSVTKFAVEITDPNALLATVQRAIDTSQSGRKGPVLVSLPLDVTTAEITRPGVVADVRLECHIDDAILRKVAGTLWNAKRPVIYVGSGCRWDDGPAHLRQLAERLQAPVMTTPKAKGVFPESHPLSLGVFGHGGHPSATRYLEAGADVVLAIGTGMTDPATDGWSTLLAPTEHLIQIDIDGLQIGRNYPVSLGLVGDAGSLVRRIRELLPKEIRVAKDFGIEWHDAPSDVPPAVGGLHPAHVLMALQAALPSDALYTSDIGEHLLFATHYLTANDPHAFTIMTGLASMGSGIGAAVGLQLAFPERTVVSVCGDGGLAMTPGDIAVAVREKLPLVVAVLNNACYAMVELGQEAIYGRTPSYSCDEVDVVRLSEGMGARAVRIETCEALTAALRDRPMDGPLVLDIRVDATAAMPRNNRFSALRAAVSKKRAARPVATC